MKNITYKKGSTLTETLAVAMVVALIFAMLAAIGHNAMNAAKGLKDANDEKRIGLCLARRDTMETIGLKDCADVYALEDAKHE